MFKNRKLEVRLVKDEAPIETTPTLTAVDYVAIANEAGKRLLVGAVVLVGAIALAVIAETVVDNLTSNNN